jgi:glycosyltransferase involved in cell wall biosynthesis
MTKLPKISIITPSMNQGTFIERTIRSILEQNYPGLEYIVMDGGSTDETLDILRQYENNLKWSSEKDAGQADAINKGIRLATGDIIAYLNSDDVLEPGALLRVAEYFAAHPEAMWLTGKCRIIDEHDREIRGMITAYKNFLLRHYSYGMLLVTNPISQPATFWRREIMQEFGLFDVNEHLVMDYEYWLRIGRRYSPGILDEYLARFRVHGRAKTVSTNFSNFKQELAVAKKYSRSKAVRTLHYANYALIVSAYVSMAMLSRVVRTLSSLKRKQKYVR